jgi:hypothetical protein
MGIVHNAKRSFHRWQEDSVIPGEPTKLDQLIWPGAEPVLMACKAEHPTAAGNLACIDITISQRIAGWLETGQTFSREIAAFPAEDSELCPRTYAHEPGFHHQLILGRFNAQAAQADLARAGEDKLPAFQGLNRGLRPRLSRIRHTRGQSMATRGQSMANCGAGFGAGLSRQEHPGGRDQGHERFQTWYTEFSSQQG